MRDVLRDGYSARDFRADMMAGLVVGIVALPLSMALAIASGVPPQYGLYTAIVAGFLIAALGGSRVSVSGPTAAFVVLLAPVSAKYGLGGLAIASVLAGFLLVIMGVARLGKLIQFVPHPVTAGFTAGIGVVIATLQIKDFLGLETGRMPDHYVERVMTLWNAMPSVHWPDVMIGCLALAILVAWPRVTRRVPGALVALLSCSLLAYVLHHSVPGFSVATIASRFTEGIPQQPPLPLLPWHLPGPDGKPLEITLDLLRELAVPGIAIAMLGAIESLLCAVVADGMTGEKHDPDAELLAQGIGNVVAPFFGGFAATGAIARTATNIRSGGRSPVAAMIHAVFVLVSVLALAPLLGYLPMAALAALLLLVAWNMSEAKDFVRLLRTAPTGDAVVLATCFTLTVLFDMVIAVGVGVVLAALLFMRRVAELTGGEIVEEGHPGFPKDLPGHVVVYEIAGPLFFGAAEHAMAALEEVDTDVRTVILDMRSVPAMDATGVVNLEAAIDGLHRSHIYVILGGVRPEPLRTLTRAGFRNERGRLAICRDFQSAIDIARHVEPEPQSEPTPVPEGPRG